MSKDFPATTCECRDLRTFVVARYDIRKVGLIHRDDGFVVRDSRPLPSALQGTLGEIVSFVAESNLSRRRIRAVGEYAASISLFF